MRTKSPSRLALAAFLLSAGAFGTARAQTPAAAPLLREARTGEVWITHRTIEPAPASGLGHLTASTNTYGEAASQISFSIAQTGLDAAGAETSSWSPERAASLGDFLDKMLPVLRDLYGPPATTSRSGSSATSRYSASAILVPATDEIHAGDEVAYQLLTHELVHAWRRDRTLSRRPSGSSSRR